MKLYADDNVVKHIYHTIQSLTKNYRGNRIISGLIRGHRQKCRCLFTILETIMSRGIGCDMLKVVLNATTEKRGSTVVVEDFTGDFKGPHEALFKVGAFYKGESESLDFTCFKIPSNYNDDQIVYQYYNIVNYVSQSNYTSSEQV